MGFLAHMGELGFRACRVQGRIGSRPLTNPKTHNAALLNSQATGELGLLLPRRRRTMRWRIRRRKRQLDCTVRADHFQCRSVQDP